MAGIGGKIFQGKGAQFREDDLPVFKGMIELEQERFHRLQDPAVPLYGLAQDDVLGIHRYLVNGGFFQVDAQGIRIEDFLRDPAFRIFPVCRRYALLFGHSGPLQNSVSVSV